jgi:hypothetical protein
LAVSFFFAAIYYFFQDKDSFNGSGNKTFLDCLYFSLNTQATIGYGDIVPKSEGMRFLVSLQIVTAYSLPLLTVMTNNNF